MRAVLVEQQSEGTRLVWGETEPVQISAADEVLVDVKASAVNRADLLQAAGGYAPPAGASPIIGLEMAGVIRAVGEGVREWQPGDRVCALLPGGGYAEQVVVPQGMLLKLPDDWSFAQGAAVPEVWLTAFLNLFLEGGLSDGETVLIHAGASGVGTAAIQLARAARARAFVTAGSAAKLASCRELGAELAINYKEEDFVEPVLAATDGQGVHLILDPVGADYWMRNLKALRWRGRLVMIGLLSGGKAEVNLGLVLGKMARVIGSTLRNRPVAEKIWITEQFRTRFWPALVAGDLQPIIDTSFPMAEAQAAHDYVAANRNTGKVILTLA
ncbi:MAG: NAD(P)H-quinone oxidoreductase [Anaerolineales bacterium]|nr:NAD(P)H-quinone oxidoreductase [Anaerolineales bacterium]